MHYRILVLGKFRNYLSWYLHGVMEGIVRNGWQAERVDIQNFCKLRPKEHIREMEEQIVRFKPHIMFTHSLFGEGMEYCQGLLELLYNIRKIYGTKVCHQMGDPRMEPRININISPFVDLALFNFGDEDILAKYKAIWGIPCYFWPMACWYQKSFTFGNPIYDMVFTGNRSPSGRYKKRTKFLNECTSIDSFKFHWFPDDVLGIRNTRFITSEIAAASKVILGLPIGEDFKFYLDTRPFQYGGAGALIFQWALSGYKKLFRDGEYLVFFNDLDVEELKYKYMHYCVRRPEQGFAIRERMFNFMQTYHNYKNRVEDVVMILEGRQERTRIYWEDFVG